MGFFHKLPFHASIQKNQNLDKHTKEQRRKNMQAVKNKNSKIELLLRKALWHKGVRYRINDKKVFGKPDISIKKYKIAVFCDSEFWHGKDWETKKLEIKSNQDFWYNKIEKNIERDKLVNKTLEKDGYFVLRFWGKEIHKNLNSCVEKIINVIQQQKTASNARRLYENGDQERTSSSSSNES